MAKLAPGTQPKPNAIQRLLEFIQEVRTEMSKVAWPSRDDLKSSTSVVLVLLFILGAIVAFYDVVSQYVVLLLLRLG